MDEDAMSKKLANIQIQRELSRFNADELNLIENFWNRQNKDVMLLETIISMKWIRMKHHTCIIRKRKHNDNEIKGALSHLQELSTRTLSNKCRNCHLEIQC